MIFQNMRRELNMRNYLRNLEILKIIWKHPLNKRRRIASLFKFFKFQIIGRLKKSRTKITWIQGLQFYASPGETGMTINIYCSLSEPNEMLFMLHYLRDSDLFFDIGANAGSYSILARGIINCHVYSFEPVIKIRERLIDNLELNNFSTDDVQPFALGAKSGLVKFTNELDATNHVLRISEDSSSDIVKMVTLNDYAYLSFVSLIKIDVEGFEMEILKGASEFLRKKDLNAIIIETNGSTEKYGSSNIEIQEYLSEFDFFPVRYHPVGRLILPLNKVNDIGNTIFVRDVEIVKRRIQSGEKIRIHDSLVL